MERTSILGLSEHTLASQASSPPGSVDATPGKGAVACLVNQYSYWQYENNWPNPPGWAMHYSKDVVTVIH